MAEILTSRAVAEPNDPRPPLGLLLPALDVVHLDAVQQARPVQHRVAPPERGVLPLAVRSRHVQPALVVHSVVAQRHHRRGDGVSVVMRGVRLSLAPLVPPDEAVARRASPVRPELRPVAGLGVQGAQRRRQDFVDVRLHDVEERRPQLFPAGNEPLVHVAILGRLAVAVQLRAGNEDLVRRHCGVFSGRGRRQQVV